MASAVGASKPGLVPFRSYRYAKALVAVAQRVLHDHVHMALAYLLRSSKATWNLAEAHR